jgi:hypothetical protein
VPSRIDLYLGMKALLQAAGMKTVQRGIFYPEEGQPGTLPPLAAYYESPRIPQRIEPGNYGYQLTGQILVDLWFNSGDPFGKVSDKGDACWKEIDDMHDAIIQRFATYFGAERGSQFSNPDGTVFGFSNTTVVKPMTFEPFYWYTRNKTGYYGAEFKFEYSMAFA